MPTLNDTRQAFLDYFSKHDHKIVPSSPLVPHNDPTLMFVNAGMVPFKNIFTGAEKAPAPRAASSQKCVRAGGKHNDLDNVGYTARHHTFFEMLGNFSFGDYFKEQAITHGWNLVHKTLGLPADRLTVTVYHTDDEAFNLWKKISGLPENRIVRIATNDNFWSMGDTGPCGPCSEIFYDHGDKIAGGPPGSPDADGDRFVEIWNLVFMQFEKHADGTQTNLPKPSIDTGMGLERISAVMQGVHDNFEIDVFRELIGAIKQQSGNAKADFETSRRVIADHLRAATFLVADGVLPSNEGRGYVLRRIMRRAMRHAHMIGCKEPLMYKLVPALTGLMGKAYPEILRAEALVTETLKSEETRFKETLERGLKLLDQETERLRKGANLPGDIAFKLYDTYGFPLDLTEDILKSKGIGIDQKGFDVSMAEQKKKARAAWKGSGETATEDIWFNIRERIGATEFLGYDLHKAKGEIVAMVKDGKETRQVKQDDAVYIITNQTPFYGESGGQAGDSGVLSSPEVTIRITDTKKYLGDLHVHVGIVEKGVVKTGQVLDLEIDEVRRNKLRANHSATHILHAALKKVLGAHVTQKGSLVAGERLRFDISHPKPMMQEEIQEVEREVNRLVRENHAVDTKLMKTDEAISAGAVAMFGEKYGDEVRVLSMGFADDKAYSVELCGGTHVRRTGDIGFFKIIKESGVSAGVRRIEAVTGDAALAFVHHQNAQLQTIASALKSAPEEVGPRIEALLEERKKLEKELKDAQRLIAMGGGGASSSGTEVENISGVKFIGKVLQGVPGKDLKPIADDFKKQVGSGVVALAAVDGDKLSLIVGVTEDLTAKLSAVDLVKIMSEATGGKGGGGRPDLAQAGGADTAKAEAAIAQVKAKLAA